MAKMLGYLTVDPKGRTTLPQSLRRELGLREGTHIRVERSDAGTIELVPTAMIPQDQLWFHTKEIQSRIARAEDDFRSGRSTKTHGEEETQAFLDSLKSKGGKARKSEV